ncbi:MAG: hypothetical protein HOC23_21900 [Halieaceae bacterium]|jgi:pimeloyl-ACP methyl ester carboxylesterase|nr:hypothetical protein [Halieaceae bacterium]
MRLRSRLCITVLAACQLLACSDSHDSAPDLPPPVVEPPAPVEQVFSQTTFDIPSDATPAFTPGTPGVVVDNARLITQFGSDNFSLNNARYTRYYLSGQAEHQPDAILVAIPGFMGGASTFFILAENLIRRALEQDNLVLELWALDRRSNQLEDTVGLDIAEDLDNPQVGLDFLFGDSLGMDLGQTLVDGPNRRALFYNSNVDTAFMAQWTTLVHSQDIDAVIEMARSTARSSNVFLGGHSAGTGYTARYAATDFNLSGGEPDPGYKKLRGLVLLEGGGASLSAQPPDEAALDLMEAQFDGGLYGAVRDQAPRCIDGLTPCETITATTDCGAFSNTACVLPQGAFSEVQGLLSPQLMAVSEVTALDAIKHGDTVQSILQQDQGGETGNNAVARVPQLAVLSALLGDAIASSTTLQGKFLDDDGLAASIASFLATSLGFEGPEVDGVQTWLSKGEDIPAEAYADNGPAPELLTDIGRWGTEAEPTDLEGRMLPIFFRGATNFSDWYYPNSGLSITDGLGLDTTPLSAPPPLGRGRSDIDNRSQAGMIDIPVIAFGGSNGLTTVPAAWLGFANAIGPCTAPSCDGINDRILDRLTPSEAFPSFGGVAGGFEVFMSEGYSHVDILTADDDDTNNVIGPLLEFIGRNLQ